MLDRRSCEHALQDMSEIFEDDDRLRAGVLQLVFQFASRIEGIHVDHHHARAEYAKQRDWILQQIGHHQRDARSWRQTQSLKPARKVAAEAVKVRIRADFAEVPK